MVIALNMTDEAEKENIFIDEEQLSKIIGKPCVKTSARDKIGIDILVETLITKYESPKFETKLIFSDVIEEEIENITSLLEEKKI